MRFRLRGTVRLGPLFFRFTQRGFSSWGVQLGKLTHNFTHGRTSLDTPGPGSLVHRRKRRSPCGRACRHPEHGGAS